jgi:anhydro-N-acetylmuramic acid kinase
MRVCGIMSGTSLDGIDVAIVDIDGPGRVRTVAFQTTPYPEALREALLAVSNAETHTATIARLHFLLGELYARAVRNTCRRKGVPLESIELIGCHGQTIFHEGTPTDVLGTKVASTLQIGEPSVIAERLGIPVVADFRPRDIAAGGSGAPLVPFVDYLLLRSPRNGRVALNIGGIANITAIPPAAKPEQVFAFDTGPGNMVIDALVARHTNGKLRYDRDGRIARSGHVDRTLLAELMSPPYYRRKPPKSAGREQYGVEFVDRLLRSDLPLPDLIATATALTAATIAAAIGKFVRPRMRADELIVSGGGAHNPEIMGHLAALLPETAIATSADYGMDIDAKEAIAFAILARETWRRKPSNLPSATGARRQAVLGKLIPVERS